jgi:hypothetical protein
MHVQQELDYGDFGSHYLYVDNRIVKLSNDVITCYHCLIIVHPQRYFRHSML